jgi:gamma-F420-2:alpha-L-glutamate ligase
MNYNGWVIYRKQDAIRNHAFIDWFIEECEKKNMILHLVLREDLQIGVASGKLILSVKKESVSLPDFAIVRTIEPLLNKQLEDLGITVFNSSRVSQICNDKAKTHQYLARANIPMVDTMFVPANLLTDVPFDYPVVIKSVNGRSGKDVFMVENDARRDDVMSQLAGKDLIIQKVADQPGKDLRVFVVENEIIGAVLRESKTQFKANYSLGGNVTFYHLNEKEKTLVQKIISKFEFGMVGIDFLFNQNGDLLLNEIEDIVGSRSLSVTSDINILEKYTTYIRSTLQNK